jgi:hypothetical protein
MTVHKQRDFLATVIVCFTCSWITVGLRIYVRGYMSRSFKPADWMMVATQIVFTGYLICQLGVIQNGGGQHTSGISTEQGSKALMVRPSSTLDPFSYL